VSAESHGWGEGDAHSTEEVERLSLHSSSGPATYGGMPRRPSPSDTAARTSEVRQRRCEATLFTLTSGGSRRELDQAGTKLNRTFRWGLSILRSTNTTDCHVPSAGRPPNTGRVIDGLTNAGRTWSAP
jgi:hypothetical protein